MSPFDTEIAIPIQDVRSRVQKFPAWHIKAATKWKMLWGIYSVIYGEVNVSVEKCVEMKGEYVEK